MIIIYQTNMNNKIYDVIFEMIFSRGVIFILFFFRLIRILNMQTRRKIKIGSYVDDIEDFNI